MRAISACQRLDAAFLGLVRDVGRITPQNGQIRIGVLQPYLAGSADPGCN